MTESSKKRSVGGAALTAVCAPLAGAAAGYVLLVSVLLPRLGVGDVERIVQLGHHLDHVDGRVAEVVFLGDSVTMEGIDASIVREVSHVQGRIENLALSGCGVNEQRVLLPKLLAAHPAVVVLAFGPASLAVCDDLPPDKAYAYAMAGFSKAWPERYGTDDFPGFSQATVHALCSTPLEQRMHFRTAPLNWLNARLRAQMRGDLRSGATADWIRPYRMLGSVPEETLAWHLDTLRANLSTYGRPHDTNGIANMRRLVASARLGGAMPVLTILPVHPRLRDDVAPLMPALKRLLTELAQQYRGATVDASQALTADQFADALHPNAAGREVYSRFVGAHLPPSPKTTGRTKGTDRTDLTDGTDRTNRTAERQNDRFHHSGCRHAA